MTPKRTAALALAATLSLLAANALADTTRASVQSASADAPARDADTSRHDVTLINQCVERGGDKQQCLCVAQVLKYELSVADYAETARGWTVAASVRTGTDGVRRTAMDETMTALVQSGNFAERCTAARRYFGQPPLARTK